VKASGCVVSLPDLVNEVDKSVSSVGSATEWGDNSETERALLG